ncbi:MAG: Hsp20/alpha crystallin family protein [Trueperaceae bacterium]|nr:MAG: Hsp20/alpha crystallin family protein [Trueperaceae bacterium]
MRRSRHGGIVPTWDMIDRFFDRFFDEEFMRPRISELEPFSARGIPLDVYEEGDTLKVKASIPGIKPEDLHVEVSDDQLHIWGEAKEEKERREETYYLHEHRYGRVERCATLPYAVLSDKAKAEFENGTLTLTLPKAAEVRGKEIRVEVKN